LEECEGSCGSHGCWEEEGVAEEDVFLDFAILSSAMLISLRRAFVFVKASESEEFWDSGLR
jgi:hypothetical protein